MRTLRIQLGFMLGVLSAAALSACATVEGTSEATLESADVSSIHQAAFVFDAHADIYLPASDDTFAETVEASRISPDKLVAGGYDAVVVSLAARPRPRTEEGRAIASNEAMAKLDSIRRIVSTNSDTLAFATTRSDIAENMETGHVSVLLGLQNAQSLEGDLSRINDFLEAGVRFFGLSHVGNNDYADSSRPIYLYDINAYEPEEHGGLSPLGRSAIEQIDVMGGIIDVSQMSTAATLQAIELTSTPVIASHSNARVLSQVTRNLTDEELDAIAADGGVVGLIPFSSYLADLSDPELRAKIRDVRVAAGLPEVFAYPFELYWDLEEGERLDTFIRDMRFLVGNEDLNRFVDHIDYVVDRIGIDHVGIGSDFNHGGGIAGFFEADEAEAVTAELLNRGYTPEDINKIWGENLLRVLSIADAKRR